VPFTEFLFTDDARIDSYCEQIAAPVMYDKVPVWKASLSLTGPSAEATQSRVARALTRFEKLKRVIEFLKKEKQLVIVRAQSDRRNAPPNSFLLETCTAVKVRIPKSTRLSGADGLAMTLWVADPLEREDVDTWQTCALCLMQHFSKADDAALLDDSMFSVLEVLLVDSSTQTRGTPAGNGLMALARDGKAHIDFGRHPDTVLKKLGAKVSRPRVITALYRQRFTGHETDLDDEGVLGEYPYSSHAILYGYAIAIAAGRASLA